jgi:hypothetical protein
MFGMDLIDFDVKKMAPEFKMAAKNCFWSRVRKYAFFFKTLFEKKFLDFLSVLRSFYGKLFFLIQKSLYFQKILYNQRQMQNQKFKWIYKGYILKKKQSIDLQAEKFNMEPKTKMAGNLEFLLKFYSLSMVCT